MKKVLNILRSDLKRRLRSPWGVIIMMIIPVAMTALFGLVFGGGTGKNIKIKVLVEDRDKSFFSNLITRSFETPQMKKFIEPKITVQGEGEKLITNGKASALFIIPKGFGSKLVNMQETELVVLKNPAEQFFPQVIEDLSGMAAKLLSAFSLVFHDEISAVSDLVNNSGKSREEISYEKIFAGSYKKIEKVMKFLSPLLFSLKTKKANEKKGTNGLNIFSMLLPPISIMFLMFIIEMFLRDILSEKESGLLQRILTTPVKPSTYVLSKMISGWLMGVLVYALIVFLGIVLFGINWGNYYYLAILVFITSFAISAFFAFLNSIFKDKNQASNIAAPVILVLSAIGGSMIPYSMLPAFIKKISFLSVNYWFMDGAGRILKSEFPVNNIIIIGVLGIFLFIVSFNILVRRISQ